MLLGILRDWVALVIHQPLFAHDLEGFVEGVQIGLGRAVGVEVVIGPGEVLAVVAREVDVVQRVVCRAVNVLLEPVARNHVAVVDEDGPDLHRQEEHHVEVLLDRANEGEDTAAWVRYEHSRRRRRQPD